MRGKRGGKREKRGEDRERKGGERIELNVALTFATRIFTELIIFLYL